MLEIGSARKVPAPRMPWEISSQGIKVPVIDWPLEVHFLLSCMHRIQVLTDCAVLEFEKFASLSVSRYNLDYLVYVVVGEVCILVGKVCAQSEENLIRLVVRGILLDTLNY